MTQTVPLKTQTGPPTMQFIETVRPDLDRVEQCLRESVLTDVGQMTAIGNRILGAGGKRLRPGLVALSARAISVDADADRIANVGAALELVHMATLVHDDVVDNSDVRRGTATANAVFGNGMAVITGDFLLARSMSLLTRENDMEVVRIVADVTIEMAEGEVLEMLAARDAELGEDAYMEIVTRKTAAFLAGCCRAGALVAHASPDQVAHLSDYGLLLGRAFQIADDVLDYAGDPAITGKPAGGDLREGRATLPLLHALRTLPETDRRTVLEAFGRGDVSDAEVLAVIGLITECGAVNHALRIAESAASAARDSLCGLPAGPAADSLAQLADYVVHRNR